MKKLTKRDFKKMALLGIAGGAMIASQTTEAQIDSKDYSNALASKCGGEHGCGHGQTAYRNIPQPASAQYYYNDNGMQGGCGGMSAPQGFPTQQGYSGCGGFYPPQGMPQQYSAGCGAARPQAGQPTQPGYPMPTQMTAGCGAARPQGSQPMTQMTAGCGGSRAPQGAPTAGGKPRETQWETADNSKADEAKKPWSGRPTNTTSPK